MPHTVNAPRSGHHSYLNRFFISFRCKFHEIGVALALFGIATLALSAFHVGPARAASDRPLAALLDGSSPVPWWFAFKFDTAAFPNCAGGATRQCIFGGSVQQYHNGFSQQFVFASKGKALKPGNACLGDTMQDPVGATFDQIYHGDAHYVIWNDQFYKDPDLPQCRARGFCEAPWGHAKGILAWNDAGDGVVMQVSTPNWPGAGNESSPRQRNGNTLGCITSDGTKPQDDILLSQGFFAARLNKDDVKKVAQALLNAGVVTQHDSNAPDRKQVVNNGGPQEISDIVDKLGEHPSSTQFTDDMLSSGVRLISKSAGLQVPPWHMVSAILGGVDLRVATFYGGGGLGASGRIPDTHGETPGCWDQSLGTPGAVINAMTGSWDDTPFGLVAGSNHAKLAVALNANLVVSGDLNQEGFLSGNCGEGHNGRGGLFFVVDDATLADGVRSLLGAAPGTHTGTKDGQKKKKKG